MRTRKVEKKISGKIFKCILYLLLCDILNYRAMKNLKLELQGMWNFTGSCWHQNFLVHGLSSLKIFRTEFKIYLIQAWCAYSKDCYSGFGRFSKKDSITGDKRCADFQIFLLIAIKLPFKHFIFYTKDGWELAEIKDPEDKLNLKFRHTLSILTVSE